MDPYGEVSELNEAEELNRLAQAVAVLQSEHKALAERFEQHERKQNGSLDKIWAELKEITKALTATSQAAATPKGPTWGVTFALGIMGSLVVGLAVALIKG
jgi:uncharacterized protein involved in exopolysaccharide biosynthesis